MPPVVARFSQTRATIRRHRESKRALDRKISAQSRRALDWMNLVIADVQEGFGAFVAFCLADLGWMQGSIGLVLTIGRVAGALSLIPLGALVDAVRWKRTLVAGAIVTLAASALILALHPTFQLVVLAEILHGVTAGIIGPAIAAISLGIVGRQAMSARIGRNQRFSAMGNALTASAMGVLGSSIGNSSIFLAAAALTVPALIALGFIRKEAVDYDRARNSGKDHQGRPTLQGLSALVANRQLLWFAGSTALFQLADASMLTLAVEEIGRAKSTGSTITTAAMVVAPQIVVALLAPWIGYFSELWGRRLLLAASFAVQIVRAVLFMVIADPILLIVIQALDGVSGATRTVLVTVIVADLTTGTGRFNLVRGAIGLVMTIAAAISTVAFGFIVQVMPHWVAFLGMAVVALVGGFVVWFVL